MALNTCELWSNSIKIASFFFTKNWTAAGSLAPIPLPDPRLWWAWVTLVYSAHFPIYTFALFIFSLNPIPIAKSWLRANTQATTSDIPMYNIFVPQKVPLSKISEHVITCDLVPPIKNPGYTYAPGRTCTPAIGYFHDKTKISKEFLRVDYYLPLKYSRRQWTLLPSTWAKSLTLKLWVKGGLNNLNFSAGFQMLTI